MRKKTKRASGLFWMVSRNKIDEIFFLVAVWFWVKNTLINLGHPSKLPHYIEAKSLKIN
jgi:hypothetical protein